MHTHKQGQVEVEVVFEVLPPLAGIVGSITAAVVTLGGLVWSPAKKEEFLEAKYKRVGGT